MKGVLVVSVLAICFFSVFAQNECPAVEEDPEVDILFPHETDCGLFYKCSRGQKVLQFCPLGLHYNAEKQYCDWPIDAGCEVPT